VKTQHNVVRRAEQPVGGNSDVKQNREDIQASLGTDDFIEMPVYLVWIPALLAELTDFDEPVLKSHGDMTPLYYAICR
jgi:hypothetical protein